MHELVERGELLNALPDVVERTLTPHQREVFGALALNGVPIDVLTERLGTSRGALYRHCTTLAGSSRQRDLSSQRKL